MNTFRQQYNSIPDDFQREECLKGPEILARSGYTKEVFIYLSDFDFIDIKIQNNGIDALLLDYDFLNLSTLTHSPEYDSETAKYLRLIQKILRQNASILTTNPYELPSYLISHLSGQRGLEKLILQVRNCSYYSWFEPLTYRSSSIYQPLTQKIPTGHSRSTLAISSDGNWAAAADRNSIKVWNTTTRNKVQCLETNNINNDEVHVDAISISQYGQWIVSGGCTLYCYVIDIFNLQTEKFINRISLNRSTNDPRIKDISISQNGQIIVVHFGFYSPSVFILDKNKNETILQAQLWNYNFYRNKNICDEEVVISPNGKWVVVCDNNLYLKVWNLEYGRLEYSLNFTTKTPIIKAVSLSENGHIYVLLDNQILESWELNLENISESVLIEESLKNINEQKYRNRTYNSSFICFLSIFIREIILLCPWLLRFRLTKIVFRLIFLLSAKVHKLISFIEYVIQHRTVSWFDEHYDSYRIDKNMAELWRCAKTFSSAKSQIHTLDFKGLSVPETFSVDKAVGLSYQDGDIQIVDLPSWSPGFSKTESTPSEAERSKVGELWQKPVAVSSDGYWVLSYISENTLELWDITGRIPPSRLAYQECLNPVDTTKSPSALNTTIRITAKSPNGCWLFLVFENYTFEVCSLSKSREDKNSHWSLWDISINGEQVLWRSDAGTLRLTDLQTGKLIGNLYDYYGVSFAENNARLPNFSDPKQKDFWARKSFGSNHEILSISDNFVLIFNRSYSIIWSFKHEQLLALWDATSGNVKPMIPSHITLQDIVAVEISYDARNAVIALGNGKLKVCNLIKNELIYTLDGHTNRIIDVSISQDSCWVVSSCHNRKLNIWNLKSGELFCSLTTDSIIISHRISVSQSEIFITACHIDKHIHVYKFHHSDKNKPLSKATKEPPIISNYWLALPEYIKLAVDQDHEKLCESNTEMQQLLHQVFQVEIQSLPEYPISALKIDYRKLRKLLEERQWEAANIETQRLIYKICEVEDNFLTEQSFLLFPYRDLKTINLLWLIYSHGKYSFSIQMHILNYFSELSNSTKRAYFNFLNLTGRSKRHEQNSCEDVSLRNGHFPFIDNPNNYKINLAFLHKTANCLGMPITSNIW